MEPRTSPGPDPVWGLGVFLIGLVVMAIGGAGTWHILFNVGETLLLLGAAVFVVCVAITARRQNPVPLRNLLRSVLGRGAGRD
ncbi:MAG: hypothetical protein KC731_14385 [Myxococcales bacterium]|nr:hypothetical protein [Myxococcales bacterium]